MEMSQLSRHQKIQLVRLIQRDTDFFFKHYLGVEPWDKQREIARSVIDNRVTTVRSCHAAGKSFTASCIAAWFLTAFPESIVVTTAPTWRQVKEILWREIATRHKKAKIPLGGNEPTVTGWEISTNWFAIGLSTKDPDRFQGFHADSGNLLVITDEAAGIPELIFEGVDAILTSDKCRLLMIGNPTSSSGTFRDSHKKGYPANQIKISAFDTPNFTANGIHSVEDLLMAFEGDARLGIAPREVKVVSEYLCGPKWVYERVKKWGADSPMFQGRVAGEFPTQPENTLIPLNWIEAACTEERFAQIPKGKLAMGVDVARFGSDRTTMLTRYGNYVNKLVARHKEDTMETAGRVWAELPNDPSTSANIDVIGVGSGVVDRLKELQREATARGIHQWAKIRAVNVATKPDKTPEDEMKEQGPNRLQNMRFANLRAQLYWELRTKFERGEIALDLIDPNNPQDTELLDDLIDELSCIQYKYVGDVIYIEEKTDIKKRLNKSPDLADALMLSYGSPVIASWPDPEEDREKSGKEGQQRSRDEYEIYDEPITAGMGSAL